MASDSKDQTRGPWVEFYGPNLGYVNEMYERYREDSESVDENLRELFDRWGAPPLTTGQVSSAGAYSASIGNAIDLKKVVAAVTLVQNIRTYGHLAAKINPLEEDKEASTRLLDPAEYGLSEADLKEIPADIVWANAPDEVSNGLEAITRLREIYTKSISFEFSHVHDEKEKVWLNRMVETGAIERHLSSEDRVKLLERLTEVEGFEKFLHRTFVGQKRFSIEGVDMLVPMLDEIIRFGVHDGASNVMIGMAHRGRLNVLAHVLGKPYEAIFAEFHHSPNKDLIPSEGSMGINYGWTGDVKYHLGADLDIEESNTVRAHLTLANNPSHLEFVDPIVEGYARAAQEDRSQPGEPKQKVSESFAILIHGDAAFPGEGIVSETLNLSRLPGYQTGGAVHIIANNQLGFTTESRDDRSTKYASDLAKGFEIPIVHVNADDPEACLAAIEFAYQYRKLFKKDFLVDLVGYRRFGHNEMDDPSATQPLMYEIVNNHPTVRKRYADQLSESGVIDSEKADQLDNEIHEKFQDIFDQVKENGKGDAEVKEGEPPGTVRNGLQGIETAVPLDNLREINADLLKWPDGFNVYSKLKRILKRRVDSLEEGNKVDWGHAETLALATILQDGTPIRMTGQDTQRGTFAHRHLMLHDEKTGDTYSPLHQIPQAKASFAIFNSPLSEASVIGFEYGYNVTAPETLVIWEAQYGDFANAGQVMFDQFISAGRAKWGQKSSMVILLPHGYEGQGPEHSSARPERYLQLAAENNWTVANLTSSAQYFHILRRQAAIVGKEEARPLVIMTPKSLIRNQNVAVSGELLSEGKFHTVLEQPGLGENPDQVERLVLCTGKIAIDLHERLEKEEEQFNWLHILRVEQLYPFPKEEIENVISRFKNLKEIVWVQEEPQNMGAWTYIDPLLRETAPKKSEVHFIGRPRRSSPATGEPGVHKKEQERILTAALNKGKFHTGGNGCD
ncbi:MAG TPA: 2-oxoglutarate dehydrogenase E1 component [Bacillales bacterium]|nr:2-oxoglutarate dehydrogenase E1 component [Bacillales bacterium]